MGSTRVQATARDDHSAGATTPDPNTAHGTGQQAGSYAVSTIAADATYGQLASLPSSLRRKRLAGLGPSDRAALVGAAAQNLAFLDDLFAATPDREVTTLSRTLGARFHKNVTGDHATWDAAGLRRMYSVLAALPPGDVIADDRFDDLVRKPGGSRVVIGTYDPKPDGQHDAVLLGYTPKTLNTPMGSFFLGKGDALSGVNGFNETARHEVGHAVDAQHQYTNRFMAQPMFGGWHDFKTNANAWVHEIVHGLGGPIATHPQSEQIITILVSLLQSLKDAKSDAKHFAQAARTAFAHAGGAVASSAAVLANDPAIDMLRRVRCGGEPWYRSDGGGAIGGRCYVESTPGSYCSYDAAARAPGHRCSLYQFRAPGEFFAEAYAAYYEPVKPGELKGKRLADCNRPLFDWFVNEFEHHGQHG